MKEAAQKVGRTLAGWVPDALMVSGAGAVSAGAGLIYQPAGWIVGGLFALAAGYRLALVEKS